MCVCVCVCVCVICNQHQEKKFCVNSFTKTSEVCSEAHGLTGIHNVIGYHCFLFWFHQLQSVHKCTGIFSRRQTPTDSRRWAKVSSRHPCFFISIHDKWMISLWNRSSHEWKTSAEHTLSRTLWVAPYCLQPLHLVKNISLSQTL